MEAEPLRCLSLWHVILFSRSNCRQNLCTPTLVSRVLEINNLYEKMRKIIEFFFFFFVKSRGLQSFPLSFRTFKCFSSPRPHKQLITSLRNWDFHAMRAKTCELGFSCLDLSTLEKKRSHVVRYLPSIIIAEKNNGRGNWILQYKRKNARQSLVT